MMLFANYSFILAQSTSGVSTLDATDITGTTAVLNGYVNTYSAGGYVSGYFRYTTQDSSPPVYCNDIYGSNIISTKEIKNLFPFDTSFNTTISGLSPDTTYYYCAIVSNKAHIIYGDVKTITTSPAQATSVNTNNPLVASGTSVYLNGFYNTNVPATTWFEYIKASDLSQLNNSSSNSGTTSGTTDSFSPLDISSVQNGQDDTLHLPDTSTPADNYNNNTNNNSNTNSNTSGGSSWSAKLNIQNQDANTSGSLSYLLTGLSANTSYVYHAVIESTSDSSITYGADTTFETTNSSGSSQGNSQGGNTSSNVSNNTNKAPLALGDKATPPSDAVVHFHEGIETVFTRQIVKNTTLAKAYGYTADQNLKSFAETLSDTFAKMFGYISPTKKEIRVSPVDRAAYELRFEKNKLTVYEYLDNKIVNIETMTEALRGRYGYEYYYSKK